MNICNFFRTMFSTLKFCHNYKRQTPTLLIHSRHSVNTFLHSVVIERWKLWIWIYGQWLNEEWCSVVSNSLRPYGLYSPWNSPGQNTGVGSLSLLQGIFPTQGSNPGFPHCRQILYQLSHKGSLINCVESHFPPRFQNGFEHEGESCSVVSNSL